MSTNSKSIFQSKTFGANVAMLVAYGIQMKYGFVVPPEYQAALATVVNVALRGVTKVPVKFLE